MATENDAVPGRDAYDTPWKTMIEDYFQPLLALLFPQIHDALDWSKPYEFLDKDLEAIAPGHETGDKRVDKLVKVYTRDGGQVWILIHIEVQISRDGTFAERMFVYFYRLYDKFQKEIISLAILGDDNPNWRPDHFETEKHGCRIALDFPIVKLTDYRDRLAELETSDNPFALVVAIHLASLETKKDLEKRFSLKKHYLKLLIAKGWDSDDIRKFFRFMDYVLSLPEYLDRKLEEDVSKEMSGGDKMQYVDYFERKYTKIGQKIGHQAGQRDILRGQLRVKFGDLPDWADEKLQQADSDHLTRWSHALLKESTLERVLST